MQRIFRLLAFQAAGQKSMKFPRWLVVSLLSASTLAVFSYGAWWWVTWPGRAARVLAHTLVIGGYEELTDALDVVNPAPFPGYWKLSGPAFIKIGQEHERSWLHPDSRGPLDLIVGYQEFRYGELGHEGTVGIQCGKVVYVVYPTY